MSIGCFTLIAGITNVSALHLVFAFIILGISTDTILVLWDVWRDSASLPALNCNLNQRMAYTFRRASRAVLPTCCTLVLAFLGNAFSSFMPVRAFCYFAIISVCMVYIILFLYWPAFIIAHEQSIK
jgi:predicted RND superfamily exporter protein